MVILNKYYFEEKLNLLKEGNEKLGKTIDLKLEKIINPTTADLEEKEILDKIKKELDKVSLTSIKEKIITNHEYREIDELFNKAINNDKADANYEVLINSIIAKIKFFENLMYFPERTLNKVNYNDFKLSHIQFTYFPITIVFLLGCLIFCLKNVITDYLIILVSVYIISVLITLYFIGRKIIKFLTFASIISFIENGIDSINSIPPGNNPISDKLIEKTITELVKNIPLQKNHNHKLF
ncbi:MAG: hypothetical protein CFE21_17485 [Bacteroidetes bacterium B1(2017)]|nr:MAG: hypothetical protein CFE21_17485 [Bacteroidetes bacterium B1(2017)]